MVGRFVIDEGLIGLLFPRLAAVRVGQVLEEEDGTVVFEARTAASGAACPECAVVSSRVHGRYLRQVTDLAVGGRPVLIRLTARRMVCVNLACGQRTFAEQVTGLVNGEMGE